jgi:hypothetical protein
MQCPRSHFSFPPAFASLEKAAERFEDSIQEINS